MSWWLGIGDESFEMLGVVLFYKMELSDTVLCVSVIGPDKSPLFIAKANQFQESLEIEAMIFETLSIIEKVPVKPAVRSSDRFLPRIHKNEKMMCWAYRASLKYLIIVMTPISVVVADKDVLRLLERIKDATFLSFANPFYNPFSPISSKDFEQKVSALSRGLKGQVVVPTAV